MPLLADYAITLDVFDPTSYSSEELGRLHLREIGEVMRTEGVVRDLRSGEWRRLLASDVRPWHRTGRELVRKLAAQGRLIEFQPALGTVPTDDAGWCAEALKTHETMPLTGGIIATESVKDLYRSEALVARIDRLNSAAWWQNRSTSVRLHRNLTAYRQHLEPILRCANSLQFIDPHLDPTRGQYREFADLLNGISAPIIEIHRVCYYREGSSHTILGVDEWEEHFRTGLDTSLRSADLKADVFIWDNFHDRYLISNLVGISLPNGFDTTNNPNDVTTWTRLGRDTRDDIQREFDPASRRHTRHGQFSIP